MKGNQATHTGNPVRGLFQLAIGVAVLLFAFAVSGLINEKAEAKTGDSCVSVSHNNADGLYVTPTEGGTGKAELTTNALRLTTPGQSDKAGFQVTIGTAFPLSAFSELSYRTRQVEGGPDSRALAAIKLSLDNGKTAVLEPLYDTGPNAVPVSEGSGVGAPGEWQKWEGLAEPRQWWVTGAPDTYLTWSALLAAYPDAKVTAIRVEQGSWSHGTITLVKDLRYAVTGGACVVHNWTNVIATTPPATTPPATPPVTTPPATTPPATLAPTTAAPTSSPTGSPSQTATSSPSAPVGGTGTPEASSTAYVPVGASGALPVTGTKGNPAMPLFLIGGGLILAGGGLLALFRLRRQYT